MDGNLFRGSKSTSPIDEAPPRDAVSIKRYAQHLPFQVFCCESGVHIIDPSQSFYQGLTYRSSIEHGIFNISAAEDGKAPKWSEGPCMDSAQMHFCRDLWMLSAREGVRNDAKKARDRERKGLQRGLSDEMEKIVKVVAPQYAPAVKGGGGILGFGRKAPVVVDKLTPDNTDEDDDDEWDEEESTSSSSSTAGDKGKEEAGQGLKDAAGKVIDQVIKPKEQTPEEKEQAMAADAAAAALPVEEQHPAAGVNPNPPAADGLKAKEDAAKKAEDQFVDPELLLEKEAQALEAEQKAAAVAADGEQKEDDAVDENGMPGKKKIMKGAQADAAIDDEKLAQAGNVPDAPKAPLAAKVDVEAPAPPPAAAADKRKRDVIPEVPQMEKRDDQEKKANNLPGPADPNALRDNSEAGKKRPVGVNNADEADSLDAAAPKAPEKPANTNNDEGKAGAGQTGNSGTGSGYKNRALKNSAFTPARIIVNPRCVTTYAGVSHTQLALDLFGSDDDSDDLLASGARKGSLLSEDDEEDGLGTSSTRQKSFNDKYSLREFGNAAETFVCQEMRTSGKSLWASLAVCHRPCADGIPMSRRTLGT
jgi:hypothetical protein